MKINKIDAACRQIETAIKLFFEAEDPVSTHTLISASRGILIPLAKYKNSNVLQMFNDVIIEEKAKELCKIFNEPSNFFKHAARDPNEIIDDFDETSNEYFIFFAILLYQDLGNQLTIPMGSFLSWYIGMYPGHVKDNLFDKQKVQALSQLFQGQSRQEQLRIGKQFYDRMAETN